jgi:hypothetical protein
MAQFRVVVSDGLNEAQILSDPAQVPDRSPSAFIALPWGDTFTSEEPVLASGYGYDPEDGDLPEANLEWYDETSKKIGQGSDLAVTLLPGEHTITFTVSDSLAQPARVSATVTVSGETVAEKKPLTGLWSAMIGLYLMGCGVGLVGLGVIGGGIALTFWPGEKALAALREQGNQWALRYQGGQVNPVQQSQILETMRAQDRRGNWWSLDPFKMQWQRWDGSVWQATAPPDFRRGWQVGCGVALMAVGLILITATIVILVVLTK